MDPGDLHPAENGNLGVGSQGVSKSDFPTADGAEGDAGAWVVALTRSLSFVVSAVGFLFCCLLLR
jgi:hypothetical protein